jgi:hypothetical protein
MAVVQMIKLQDADQSEPVYKWFTSDNQILTAIIRSQSKELLIKGSNFKPKFIVMLNNKVNRLKLRPLMIFHHFINKLNHYSKRFLMQG